MQKQEEKVVEQQWESLVEAEEEKLSEVRTKAKVTEM